MKLEEVKTAIEEQAKIVGELRKRHEDMEKGLFTKADFDEFETKATAKTDELQSLITKAEKDINARLDEIETKANRPALGAAEQKDEEARIKKAAFDKWLRFGENKMEPDELKALTISPDTTGGYLAEPEYVQEIVKGVTEFSPIRSIARVRTTSRFAVEVPKKTGTFNAGWTGEIDERTETTGLTYGLESAPLHEMYALVRVSKQNLEDSSFNLEAEITEEIATRFAVLEGTGFVSGNSVNKPEGLLTNADVSSVISGHATTLLPDGIINLTYALSSAYERNARFLMKRSTTNAIRLFKDATNENYIWQPAYSAGEPATLLGYPIVEAVDMPAVGAGTFPILFGDFAQAYWIFDRIQIDIQRLVEKYAEYGQVGFLARKRVEGQVVLPEAIVKQEVSA